MLNIKYNKTITHFSLLFLLSFISTQLSAQVNPAPKKASTGKISGKVIDPQNQQAIDFVTVALIKAADSSASTKGTYSDENGEFLISKLAFGKYKIILSFLGYETVTLNNLEISAINPELHLGEIKMKQTANKLKEVTVTAQRSPFQVGTNGVTYNVEESLQNSGATAVEALQRIPSVQVDPDGKVSVRGSSDIKVLIDGEPTELSKVLDMIPASALQKIEVITNPSAKYSAEGSGGIINIVTKNRGGLRGFNASVGLNGNTRNRYAGRTSINYSTRKFTSLSNYNFSPSNNSTSSILSRESRINETVNILNQLSNGTNQSAAHSFMSTNTYRFNTTNTLAFNLSLTASNNTNNNSTLNSMMDANGNEFQNFTRTSIGKHDNYTYRVGLSYRKIFPPQATKALMENASKKIDSLRELALRNPKMLDSMRNRFGSGGGGGQQMGMAMQGFGGRQGRGGGGFDFQNQREWKSEINYSYSDNSNVNNLDQIYTLPITTPLQQQSYSLGNTGTINFKTEMNYPFNNNKSRLEAGLSSDINFNESRYRILSLRSAEKEFLEDTSRTNNFDRSNIVNAGYVSLSHNFERFSFNAGLRVEQANLIADLISKNYDFTKRFITMHPSLSMSYKLDDVQSLRFAYSNRINRPGMDQLNPYINDADTLNIRYGNINLDPSRGHSFEVGFNRFTSLGSISSSVFYRRTNNMINSFTIIDNRGISYTTYANLGENISWGMDVNGNIMMLAGKLNLGIGGTLIHNSFVNELNTDFSREQYSFNGNFDARLNLPANWNFGSNLRYTGPQAFLQGRTEGFVTANMDIRKSFLKRKFNITLSADDLLNTRNSARIINSSFTQNSLNKTTTRVIRLGINYRFGGFTAGAKR